MRDRLFQVGQNILGWSFSAVFLSSAVLVVIITLGKFEEQINRRAIRFWGKMMLRISGVTVTIEGKEILREHAKRVVIFNHASTLDVFIICGYLPTYGITIIKREFLFVPFVGLGACFLGFILIDRKNRKRALLSLQKAADRMKREKLTVLVSPEGTRSRTGTLGPFKTGPLHLALKAQAPIVPMIIGHSNHLQPVGQYYVTPGHITVRILDPIPTDDLNPKNLKDKANEFHALFEQQLTELKAVKRHKGVFESEPINKSIQEETHDQEGRRSYS